MFRLKLRSHRAVAQPTDELGSNDIGPAREVVMVVTVPGMGLPGFQPGGAPVRHTRLQKHAQRGVCSPHYLSNPPILSV